MQTSPLFSVHAFYFPVTLSSEMRARGLAKNVKRIIGRSGRITDLMIDWIYLLWIPKVKPNYTIRNSLPGTTCDINLSQITLFTATMLINNCRVFKVLRNCTFLLFSHQVFFYKFVSRGLCGPRK